MPKCRSVVCQECVVFCFDCVTFKTSMMKVYCIFCKNNIINVPCNNHEWNTCPRKHKGKKYKGCGECAENKN